MTGIEENMRWMGYATEVPRYRNPGRDVYASVVAISFALSSSFYPMPGVRSLPSLIIDMSILKSTPVSRTISNVDTPL